MATLDLCGEWLICGLPDGSGKAEELAGPPCSNRQQWLSGNVPGTIQTDLFRLGRKPPPFLGKNTKEFADLEDMEWWYRKSFIAPKSLLDDRVELVFDGLDTLADVWLNGKCLAHHENMFVPLRVDVTDTLAYGEENVLVVRLRSVAKYGASLAEEASAEGRGGFSERSFVRKAQFAFHWDWAARLVTVGICAPVRLESYRGWRVMDLCVRPFIVFKGKARLAIAAEFERVAARPGPVQLALSVFSPDGELLCHQERIVSAEDSPDPYVWNVDVEIAGPQLWWPNGYGEQPLYTVAVTAACDEGELHQKTVRVGIRTVSVEQDPDPKLPKTRFVVMVNGVPIFCKGSNWVPADYFPERITRDRYERLVKLARDAHFTMLRVWGGGVYESDAFYDLCDENGILIFQDFMYACGSYPDYDEQFCETARQEAEYVVRRLRNHPCIALWAGCNENGLMPYGRRLYYEVLQGVCRRLDPTRFYLPTSPGLSAHPDSWKAGDRHAHQTFIGSKAGPEDEGAGLFLGLISEGNRADWEVLLGYYGLRFPDTPAKFEDVHWTCLRDEKGSFLSETLALPGVPDRRTLRACIPEGEIYPYTDSWLHHVPYGFPTSQVQTDLFMRHLFGIEPPASEAGMASYLRRLELIQPEGWRYGVEICRSRFPSCAGFLSWMYDTPWPNMDWSLVDYFGRPGPGYFGAKRGCAPLIVVMLEDASLRGGWNLVICNDTMARQRVELDYGLLSLTGEVLWQAGRSCDIGPCSSKKAARIERKSLGTFDPASACLYARLLQNDSLIAETRAFFLYYKDIKLPKAALCVEWIRESSRNLALRVRTDVFAWAVKIEWDSGELDVSDNVFDLLPGTQRDIQVSTWPDAKTPPRVRISAINSEQIVLDYPNLGR